MLSLSQRNREELLDLGVGTPAQMRASLRDLHRINTLMGWTAALCSATFAMLERHNLKSAHILDVGTGAADIPMALLRQAERRGIELKFTGVDINPRHLEVAREATRHEPRIQLLQADAFQLPMEDGAMDIVISSLFLHHFRPKRLRELLLECDRVARVGWIMQDLVRSPLPLWGFRLARPVLARSYLTRHDGEASIRRGYTFLEMGRVTSQLPGVIVRHGFPFRMTVSRDKISRFQNPIP